MSQENTHTHSIHTHTAYTHTTHGVHTDTHTQTSVRLFGFTAFKDKHTMLFMLLL